MGAISARFLTCMCHLRIAMCTIAVTRIWFAKFEVELFAADLNKRFAHDPEALARGGVTSRDPLTFGKVGFDIPRLLRTYDDYMMPLKLDNFHFASYPSIRDCWMAIAETGRAAGYDQLAVIAMHALALPATSCHVERINKELRRIVRATGTRVSPSTELARMILATCPDARVFLADSRDAVPVSVADV